MERKFWLERWARNQIGFHQADYNARLLRHWPKLALPDGCGVFVPLCGKTKDMRWLAEQGFKVVGIELSELAVDAYFEENNEPVTVTSSDALACHQGSTATIYQGDFFDLTASHLAEVEGCFDRGALVALPADMRRRYVDHVLRVLPDGARILLLTLEYDQALVAGPPHSVTAEEVQLLYGERCDVEQLETESVDEVPPHFREHGMQRATEASYLITKRR